VGIISGANLSSDGLVYSLDAANFRSYSGSGLTSNALVGGIGATLVNGVGFTSANGGSFTFDGTNDYINTSSIDLSNTNKASVSLWVKILNYREVVGTSNLLCEFSSNFNNTSGGFVFGFADDSAGIFESTFPISLAVKGNGSYNISAFSKTLVNDLAWHHWVCIFDKSQNGVETFLYIDGILRTPTLTPILGSNTDNFENTILNIAGRFASYNSNVSVSNFHIYNRALSAQEIKQNYNATKKRYGL
jgi:hypothetical protein